MVRKGREEKVIFLCVLSTEQSLLAPEESICGVLVAAHIQ